MYLMYDDIKTLHIEHTSRCNLLCPQCARTVEGSVNPRLPMSSLTIEDYKNIFNDKKFAENLHRIFWCGNYGDSIASNTWLECAEFVRNIGVNSLQLYTNGSARSPEWWEYLAKNVLNREYDYVYFSIDGLEDTNHLYRVNSDWNKIIENAKAFINAGGNTRWDYLIFDHNQHQIEDAKTLAKKLGFRKIMFKETSRFIANNAFKGNEKNSTKNVLDRKTKTTKHKIEITKSKSARQFDRIIENYGSWENYVNTTPIKCKYQLMKAVYIDFEAKLWPCCWMGPSKYFDEKNIQKPQLEYLMNWYGENFNSLRTHKLKDILNSHVWYTTNLENSWKQKLDSINPKLQVCGRTCGTDYEFSSEQSSSLSNSYDLQ